MRLVFSLISERRGGGEVSFWRMRGLGNMGCLVLVRAPELVVSAVWELMVLSRKLRNVNTVCG